ncbi:MAG: integrase arm-type DNA-binding domain-containing protein [Rhodospirillales bacterium]|nr:integrase arm-type DNA-binding domain-containing protein [Rhodospirillales bacterium]
MPKLNSKALTDQGIEKTAAAKPGQRKEIADRLARGLYLRVNDKGRKSWLVYYRIGEGASRKQRKLAIGSWPDVPLDEARDEARRYRKMADEGRDPKQVTQAEARQRRESAERVVARTLQSSLDQYIKAIEKDGRSERTIEDYRGFTERHLVGWLDKPLTDITPDMVRTRFDEISEEAPTAAKYTMRIFRAVYNRAVDLAADRRPPEYLPPNPTRTLNIHHKGWNNPTRRRPLAENDLPGWYKAVSGIDNQVKRDYYLLVLFTGLRRRNAAALRVKRCNLGKEEMEVDGVLIAPRSIFIPRTKNKTPLSLPLSAYLVDLIKDRIEANNKLFPESPWVFPAHSKAGHLTEPKDDSVPGTVHALRGTFITAAKRCQVPVDYQKALVAHALRIKGDVTDEYAEFVLDDLRPSMQRITDRLWSKLTPPESEKVVAFNG